MNIKKEKEEAHEQGNSARAKVTKKVCHRPAVSPCLQGPAEYRGEHLTTLTPHAQRVYQGCHSKDWQGYLGGYLAIDFRVGLLWLSRDCQGDLGIVGYREPSRCLGVVQVLSRCCLGYCLKGLFGLQGLVHQDCCYVFSVLGLMETLGFSVTFGVIRVLR